MGWGSCRVVVVRLWHLHCWRKAWVRVGEEHLCRRQRMDWAPAKSKSEALRSCHREHWMQAWGRAEE